MISQKAKKNKKFLLLVALLAVSIFFAINRESKKSRVLGEEISKDGKKITIIDGGSELDAISFSENVAELLDEKKMNIGDHDIVFPNLQDKIFTGDKIIIQRANKFSVTEGGNTTNMYTFQNTIEKALWENKVELGDDDFTKPERLSPIVDGMKIVVTHVEIKEESKNETIEFKTVTNEDDSLGWRIKKTTQKGEKGINEVKYKVMYYDGKEMSRKILEKNKIKDPVDEIVTQGTYVKVGKTYNGAASWYAYTGQLCAANPWLPMGSYARVTNKENGKSVIVKINDRGPFGNGRIIDLDKVAFAQIASLGAGVADVKVEAITN